MALATTAWVPPLVFGGAFGWAVTVIAWIACVFLAVVLWFHREPIARVGSDSAVALGLGWTAAQALPVPFEIGAGQHAVAESYQLAGSGWWTSVSLDPGATREQLVVGASVFAAYLGGRVLAAHHGRTVILRWVALSPAVVVVVSLLHELVGADRVYGWHAPKFTSPALLGPLLNPNHLGGFAGFGAALAAGLALGTESKRRRSLFGVVASLCAAVAIGVGSRGAVLSLVLGLGWVLTLTSVRRRGVGAGLRGRWLTLGGIGTVAIGLAAYVGLERIEADFLNNDLSKLDLIARVGPMVFEQPWIGIGRGAFEPVFAGLTPTSSRFTHPENLFLQWAVEWGAPCTIAMLFWFGRDLVRAARSSRLDIGIAAGALGALVIHDQVDFALEMPGIVVVVALAFGAIVTSQRADRERFLQRPALVSMAGIVLAVTVVFGSDVQGRRPETQMDTLLTLGRDTPVETVTDHVRRAVELHPLDPGVAIHAGYALRRLDRGAALGWLNRAMQLAPRWASPHVLAAAFLAEMGARDQALLEVREAEERQLGSTRDVLCRIVEGLSAERAMRALPREPDARVDVADRMVRCLGASQAAELDEAIVSQLGPVARASTRIARRLVAAGRPDDALSILDEIPDGDEAATVLRASVLRTRGKADEALAILPARPSTWDGWVLRAELAADLGDDPALERELSRLRSSAAGRVERLAEAWAVAGRIEERRNNLGAAMQAFERAHRLQPESLAHLRAVERLARRADQGARALSAGRELCRLGDEGACARLRAPSPGASDRGLQPP